MAIARFKDLCMDAIDPAVLGPFWAETLRLDWTLHDDGDGRLTGPTPQHTVWFNRVPEPKTVKNRIHWDVSVADLQPLLDAGATLLRPIGGDIRWHVLADPEGNEFCAFVD
jgi:hypothetical protein